MANREKLRIKSALKRSRQNPKRNSLKSSQRAVTRTAVKQSASEAFKKAEKVLDTMANKKVIHANKASRTKSRLNKKIKAL